MSLHDSIYIFLSSFMALFPVINPIGSAFIVNGFLEDLDNAQRKVVIKKIVINCLLIGLGSLLAGHLVLLLFNLDVPVIQLAGGILICKTGLEWLSDNEDTATDDKEKTMKSLNPNNIEKKIFYPISFPMCFGPGSISVIFTLMATESVKDNLLKTGIRYAIIGMVIVCMCVLIYIFFSQGRKIMQKMGKSGSQIINKLVAFFTFCIGIQIMVTGISKIFHIDIL